MNIQWYPGHMTKARRMMQENIKLVDLVIDAFRFIASYEGEIPGASAKECGNYRDLSLEGARQQAAEYLTAIEGYPAAWLDYDHE